MDFALTREQRHYQDRAREVAATLEFGYADRERAGRIEPALRKAIGAAGLIAPELPGALGGSDTDRVCSGLICEEIGRADINVAYLPVMGSLVGQILAANAPAELAAEWVPRMCSGEEIVGIGLTEPHAGSDAGMPRMVAEPDGHGSASRRWRLTGVKSMSFALDAAAAVVFARTGPSRERGRDVSAFLVPLDAAGVTRERVPDMGTKAVGRGLVHLDGVPAHLIGEPGRGLTQVLQGFDFSRALIGLQCLGCARGTLDETWEYASTREAFDAPLSTYQGVAFPLAEAETMLAAARLLCLRTLWLKDTAAPHTAEAAMSKWWAPKVAHDVIVTCLLTHGQYGYRTDLPIEQRLRDVLGLQIGDGTAQIMKLVIARQKLGRELAP